MALRIGRGLLVALPALGEILALYLLRADAERLSEELDRGIGSSSALFLVAGVVDGLDSLLHFFIAFALWKYLGRGRPKQAATAGVGREKEDEPNKN